jgi:starch-binding outer membrane protein, SusD/RagB family
MKLIKIFILLFFSTPFIISCKKQLDVKNPNLPTPGSAATENGIISLAQGGIYVNGFRDLKYTDGVYGLFWSGAMGFHEIMADVVQAEAANAYLNQIGCPNSVTLDDGTVVLNPNSPKEQISLIREINTNANQGANPLYYEWGYMYNMIAACNSLLDVVSQVEFPLDGDIKTTAIQAWAYWWKGYAYSRIGSTYYAGLIIDTAFSTNGTYVTKEQIITEANSNLDKAASLLGSISDVSVYTDFMARIIPDFFQVGKGGAPDPDMWKRSINTLKARNILVNKTVTGMTDVDWAAILTLVNDGIRVDDNVFTGRSNESGDFIAGTGTVAGKTESTKAGGNTYKLSERWVQDFKPGDLRLDNNVSLTTTWIGNSDRGNVFNTRYALVSGGNGLADVAVFCNTEPGEYELYLAGTYEENELMKAEALIYSNDIDGGLALIDAVRDEQGAGLAPVSGTGLSLAEAKEELRRERRIVLAFRGLSFYDARRWGVINPVAQGGGRTGVIVLDNSGNVNSNATIEYNFLDYWDVPDNELAYNPPVTGSAPVKNPK